MRPVTKGPSPYTSISDYHEARPYLKDRIGLYCSYCGFEISHLPEVEHVAAKSRGGDETAWDNLLLGCKYCNTRKGTKVTAANQGGFLWPDEDNTAVAYCYPNSIPQINRTKLLALDPTGNALRKATALFHAVGLGNRPLSKLEDPRFWKRFEVYESACRALVRWQRTPLDDMKDQIVDTALAQGFFCVWMTVFDQEPAILNALIRAFPGTNLNFYDANGHPKNVI